jgi:hypothetical protein
MEKKSMKRIILAALLMLSTAGLKAQDCELLVLPFFKNDRAAMEEYARNYPEKFAFRCIYARSAFYESDTIPAGAEVFGIEKVQNVFTGKFLDSNYVVDLNTLSFYAYNFKDLQLGYTSTSQVICFATPASAHPYLVLRSILQMGGMSENLWYEELKRMSENR